MVNFFAKKKKDLEKRTKDIADKDKQKVYMGGMGNRGAHGIESTTGNFSLFNAISFLQQMYCQISFMLVKITEFQSRKSNSE